MTASLRIPPAQARRLWLDPTVRTEDAARQLGITRQGLSDMARRMGLPPRTKNRTALKKGSDEEFRRLWLAGVRLEDMARHFGYASHRGVCARRAALGLPMRTRPCGDAFGRRWRETITIHEYHDHILARCMADDWSAKSFCKMETPTMFKPDYFIQPLGAGWFSVCRLRWFKAVEVHRGSEESCLDKLQELRAA